MIRDLEGLASQTGTDADLLIKTANDSIKVITDKQFRTAIGQFNLAQAAATYDLLTATGGDVYCDVQIVYVKTAAAGLTSAQVVTDHTTPKAVISSTVLASLILDAILTLSIGKFVLPSGKKIRGTIVGTGSAGLVYVVVNYVPLAAGATLA